MISFEERHVPYCTLKYFSCSEPFNLNVDCGIIRIAIMNNKNCMRFFSFVLTEKNCSHWKLLSLLRCFLSVLCIFYIICFQYTCRSIFCKNDEKKYNNKTLIAQVFLKSFLRYVYNWLVQLQTFFIMRAFISHIG